MLNTQYRMNDAIMRWSADEFYGGKLLAAPAVATHTLAGLPSVAASAHAAVVEANGRSEAVGGESASSSSSSDRAPSAASAQGYAGDYSEGSDDLVGIPLVFIDTAGCGLEEVTGGGGDDALALSQSNPGEAELVRIYASEGGSAHTHTHTHRERERERERLIDLV